jgi:hypothetical protein
MSLRAGSQPSEPAFGPTSSNILELPVEGVSGDLFQLSENGAVVKTSRYTIQHGCLICRRVRD